MADWVVHEMLEVGSEDTVKNIVLGVEKCVCAEQMEGRSDCFNVFKKGGTKAQVTTEVYQTFEDVRKRF